MELTHIFHSMCKPDILFCGKTIRPQEDLLPWDLRMWPCKDNGEDFSFTKILVTYQWPFVYISLSLVFPWIFHLFKIGQVYHIRSKDELQTTFLCHEGFMGAVGAFWSYENMGIANLETEEIMRQVLLGAPYTGGNGPALPLAAHLSLTVSIQSSNILLSIYFSLALLQMIYF